MKRQDATRISEVPTRGYPYFAEPKRGGQRQQFKVVEGFERNAIMRELREVGLIGYVVDGMLDPGGETDPRFDVFDAWREDQIKVYHGKVQSRSVVIPFRLRRAWLELCFEGHPEFGFVQLIEQVRVTSPTEAEQAHEAHVLHGFGGTVYKQPGASYCFEQTSGWQVLRGSRRS